MLTVGDNLGSPLLAPLQDHGLGVQATSIYTCVFAMDQLFSVVFLVNIRL